MIISDLYHGEYRLHDAIRVFMLTFISSLIWTVSLDSYLWNKPFYWPELNVFLFNTWHNGSKAYGIMPWKAYFTQMLPKIAPLAYPLSIMALCTNYSAYNRSLIPVFSFVFIYSFLPHKEWRFIMYVITPLQVSAARFLQSFKKSTRNILPLVGGILFGFSAVAMGISSYNYPGGEALDRVPHLGSIYIDTFTAMSGASRFGQALPCKPWPFSQICHVSEIRTNLQINRSQTDNVPANIFTTDSFEKCKVPKGTSDKIIGPNPTYDKNEMQTDFSSYTHILTHEPKRYSNRKVINVIYGYGGLGYNNDVYFYQGLLLDLWNAINLNWDKVIGPVLLAPQVWILE